MYDVAQLEMTSEGQFIQSMYPFTQGNDCHSSYPVDGVQGDFEEMLRILIAMSKKDCFQPTANLSLLLKKLLTKAHFSL